MGAWIQKVVKCSDLPRRNIVDGTAIDQNVKDWLELESLWYPTEENFNGCGYKGTPDNIRAVSFG
jgi:hypothetical protein